MDVDVLILTGVAIFWVCVLYSKAKDVEGEVNFQKTVADIYKERWLDGCEKEIQRRIQEHDARILGAAIGAGSVSGTMMRRPDLMKADDIGRTGIDPNYPSLNAKLSDLAKKSADYDRLDPTERQHNLPTIGKPGRMAGVIGTDFAASRAAANEFLRTEAKPAPSNDPEAA